MSTETAQDLPSVDALAASLYQATAGAALSLAYESLPVEARRGYRAFVREFQAVELRRMAAEIERLAFGHLTRDARLADSRLLRARADELDLIGGDA